MSEEIAAADSLLAQDAELRAKNEQIWKACVEQENEIARLLRDLDFLRHQAEPRAVCSTPHARSGVRT